MRMTALLASAFMSTAISDSAIAAPSPSAPRDLGYVPFEVIVKFKPSVQVKTIASQMVDISIDASSRYVTIAKIDVPTPRLYRRDQAETETLALLNRLRQRNDVEYAQLNYYLQSAFTPNDLLYTQQWHYPLISLSSAWDITRGNSAVRIAILDTGRSGHPDLNGRWSALEFNAPEPGTPATDNGPWRHGTHVAAIAGAASNNFIGGAGVCHQCQLMNVKIGDQDTGLTSAWTIAGIHWAIDNGAHVMNMSFEQNVPCTVTNQPALRAAISRAVDNGVIVIAAAGNNAVNVDRVSPASCPGAISIAATDRLNTIAVYSSRGPSIGISAPGGGSFYGAGIGCPADDFSGFEDFNFDGVISAWTTSPPSGNAHCYRHLGGTSMAVPHVAGTVGLMLSVNPTLRQSQIRHLIRGNADPLPACGSNCGPGLLNAYRSVLAASTASTGPCSVPNEDGNKRLIPCVIDSIDQYMSSKGALVETLHAYGYVWKLDALGNQIGTTKKLRAFPRYANGPCVHAPSGQECKLDSSTSLDYPGLGYIESVTAYGRGWNFDQNGNGFANNGSLLSSVARYANGPCAYASSSTTCRFDTRNIINSTQWGALYESITAYGRYWVFDGAGGLVGTDMLMNVPRYADGPCAYTPAGQSCTFDSHEMRNTTSGGMIETVIANGRYFEWDGNGVPTANNGVLLKNVARMR